MLTVTAMPLADRGAGPSSRPHPLVLVVDGDARVASFLDRALTTAGYRVEHATHDLRAVDAFEALTPDVVLLDVAFVRVSAPSGSSRPGGLPADDGLALTRQLRAQSGVPIVMLAELDSVADRVAGLDAGADDYVVKPFAVVELVARINALLRGRALAAAEAFVKTRRGALQFQDVRLDQDTREAWRGSRRLELRNKAFELLACFLRHPERVLSRRELLEEAWGYEFLGDSNVIEVTVGHVRQALESGGEPRLIHTVRPVGYILRSGQHC